MQVESLLCFTCLRAQESRVQGEENLLKDCKLQFHSENVGFS